MPNPLNTFRKLPSIDDLLQQFLRGRQTPVEFIQPLLLSIEKSDEEIGAFVDFKKDTVVEQSMACAQALAAGKAGPLLGVPLSIKDLIEVKGEITRCGNPKLHHLPAQKDALIVQKLRKAGAIIVGKVQLHEIALGITGVNPHYKTPQNPYDPKRIPGGSSSGSAVSVASGMAIASIGTDTGGSVRVPAALCGLFGFKPSFGKLSTDGVFPLSKSMDHVGIIARTLEDLRAIYHVLNNCADTAVRHKQTPRRLTKRLALVEELVHAARTDIQTVLQAALQGFDADGWTIESLTLPEVLEAQSHYKAILLAEAAVVHSHTLREKPTLFGDDVKQMLQTGCAMKATEYILAQNFRAAFSRRCEEVLTAFDALITPTTLIPAPLLEEETVLIHGRSMPVRQALIACTCPFSMVGLPALNVPMGKVAGLPVGMQVIGPRFQEELVLQIGRAVRSR